LCRARRRSVGCGSGVKGVNLCAVGSACGGWAWWLCGRFWVGTGTRPGGAGDSVFDSCWAWCRGCLGGFRRARVVGVGWALRGVGGSAVGAVRTGVFVGGRGVAARVALTEGRGALGCRAGVGAVLGGGLCGS